MVLHEYHATHWNKDLSSKDSMMEKEMWGADGEKDGGKSEVIIKNYACTRKDCQGKQSSQKGSLKNVKQN